MSIFQEGGIHFNQIPTSSRRPFNYDTPQEVETAGRIMSEQLRNGEISNEEFNLARNRLINLRTGIEVEIQAERHLAISSLRKGELSAVQVRRKLEELDDLEHPKINFDNINFGADTRQSGNDQAKSIVVLEPEEAKQSTGINFNLPNNLKGENLLGKRKRGENVDQTKSSETHLRNIFGRKFGNKQEESAKETHIINPSGTSNSQEPQPIQFGLTAHEEEVIRAITNPKPPIEVLKENAQAYIRAQEAKRRLLPQEPGDKYTTLGAGLFGRDAAIVTSLGLGIYSGMGESAPKTDDNSPAVDNMIPLDAIAEGKVTLYVAPSGRGPRLFRPLIKKIFGDIGTIVVSDHRINQEYHLMGIKNPHKERDDILNMARERQVTEAIIAITNEQPHLIEEITGNLGNQS